MKLSRLTKILLIFVLLFSFFISIGYSALNASLSVSGDLVYRVPADIRITGVKISSVTNGGLEQYSPKYTKDTVSVGLKLPNLNSTVVYEVTIKNSSSKKKKIEEITDKIKGNENISYTYDETFKNVIEPNSTATLLLTYKYNSDITSLPIEQIKENTISLTFSGLTLYNVLKQDANTNNHAKVYTGDTSTFSGKEKIYYYYGETPNNNVLFGDFCWKMYRTTDTGGVKILYNGEPDSEGKCGSDRENHVGYGYRTSQTLSSSYLYGTDYTYDKATKTFTVAGTTETATWNDSTYQRLLEKYTCKNTTGSCSTLYYVSEYNNNTSAYTLPLNSTTFYSQIGMSAINSSSNSPADVGYMYNKRYIYNSKSLISSTTVLIEGYLSLNYYYADNIDWNEAGKYSLVNPYREESSTDYDSLVGKYTFKSSYETTTSSSVYYIVGVSGSTMYCLSLSNGQKLIDGDTEYTFADSIIDDGTGKKILDPATTKKLKKTEWVTNYADYKAKYYQDSSDNICYVTSTSSVDFTYVNIANNYMYGNTFTYNEETEEYTLGGEIQHFYDWPNNYSKLNNSHYTCWNTSGMCKTISYIYAIDNRTTPYYINLEKGISVEKALDEMLHDSNINITDSKIKKVIDLWYSRNMTEYTDYLEDTVWCSSRKILSLGGWNPNGGKLNDCLEFLSYGNSNDLTCPDKIDSFTVDSKNGNGALTYPVGTVTRTEQNLAYASNNSPIGDNEVHWMLSPSHSTYHGVRGFYFIDNGDWMHSYVHGAFGVRPSVSLRSGIEYLKGDGTTDNPYVILSCDSTIPTYGEWSEWETCSKTCGGGTQTRTRTVTNKSSYDGTICSTTTESESRSCNTQDCCSSTTPTYGAWSEWGTCSKTCGGGTQTRTRTVTNKSSYDGRICSNTTQTESQACNTQSCTPQISCWRDNLLAIFHTDSGGGGHWHYCEIIGYGSVYYPTKSPYGDIIQQYDIQWYHQRYNGWLSIKGQSVNSAGAVSNMCTVQ